MKFQNMEFGLDKVNPQDYFVCVFGYEERSFFLYDQFEKILPQDNILVFFFEDYKNYPYVTERREQLQGKVECKIVCYSGEIIDKIEDYLEKRNCSNNVTIHVDYSSMPRKWYCGLVTQIQEKFSENKICFWYAEGEYPVDYCAYPSAGIDSYDIIGRPSLRIESKRLHVIGLSYDATRTKALISILDPNAYFSCQGYNPNAEKINKNVRELNEDVISQGVGAITVRIDDFSLMVAKLCEIAYEYYSFGDVVFVPDGPKPLILAMALVPRIVKKAGVTCLLVSRNDQCYEPVVVKATGSVFGFQIL